MLVDYRDDFVAGLEPSNVFADGQDGPRSV